MSSTRAVMDRINAVLHDRTGAPRIAGAVVGVAVGDERGFAAHGVANLNTGQQFAEDTGFLLGSVTKVLTTTVLMRFVERGEVSLDAPVSRYVPEFTLNDPDAAERVTVRMLVNHTNGIDADSLFPVAVRGRHATQSYLEELRHVGVLFEPGAGIHYTNPGFVVAARLIEIRTGLPFERAIARELFDPAGMRDATLVQTQAFLRRTAIGAFAGPGDSLRATSMFTLAESGAGAGTTPIVSAADMLAFGRLHLRGGLALDGTRVLAADQVDAMRSPTYDLGVPVAPPVGLGWWLIPVCGTTALWHGGGSPGGSSSFCVLPEHDAVIVSFATGPDSVQLHDLLHNVVIEELTGRPVTPAFDRAPAPIDPDLAGEYRSFEQRVDVELDGDELVVTEHYEPHDEDHRLAMVGYTGAENGVDTVRYRPVAPGLFGEADRDPDEPAGFYGRLRMLAGLPAAPGRRAGLHRGLRYLPHTGPEERHV